jgi:hypothetical protein
MKLKQFPVLIILLALVLTSCQPVAQPTATTAPKGATPTAAITYLVVTSTPLSTAIPPTAIPPTATSASLPTATPNSTATVTPAGLPDYSSANYIDDRSTAAALILSYVNAINRHEYLRAYSYWPNASSSLGTLDAFTNSYNNVTSEAVAMGQVTGEGAAGSVYYTVPAAVTDSLNGGGTNKYAYCFVLRFPQPGNYGAPPIQPLHFDQNTQKSTVNASISDANVIAAACSSTSGLPGSAALVEDLNDLSSGNYIDNRSGAVEVIKSLLNAINRKEYVRAYSYFETPATFPGSYNSYAAGFNDTGSVTAVFGTVQSDAGAGQFHYKVPLAENVTNTNSTKHLFVGCYTLHLANPGIQGTLPFQPLAITTGKLKEYAVGTDVNPLLATACN